MALWGGNAAQQTSQATDPTYSVAVDVNASVARSDLDVIQSNVDSLSASIGSPTDPASSAGNVYERLNYLDQRLDTNVGNDLGDVNTLLDVSGASVLVAATSTNRYASAFDGTDRTNTTGTVDNSIHNANPVTVREALRDLDVASTNARTAVFGSPSGAHTVSISVAGTGYTVNEIVQGGGITIKVNDIGNAGAISTATVIAGGTGFSVNDVVQLAQANAGGAAASVQVTALVGARRTDSTLGTMDCTIVADGSSVKSALRQLDIEASSARSDIGTLQNLAGFDNPNGDVVGALNELQTEVGDVTTLTTDTKVSAVAAINELDADVKTLQTDLGAVGSLTTASNVVVGAINEVAASAATNTGNIATHATSISNNSDAIGDLNTLSTTEKGSAVGAINENAGAISTNANTIQMGDYYRAVESNASGSTAVGMYLVLSDESVNDVTYSYDAGIAVNGNSLFLKVINFPTGATIDWRVPNNVPVLHAATSTYGEGLKYDGAESVAESVGARTYRITTLDGDAGVYQCRAMFGNHVISVSNKLYVNTYNSAMGSTTSLPAGDLNNGTDVTTSTSRGGEEGYKAFNAQRTTTESFERVLSVSVDGGGSGYDPAHPPAITFANMAVQPTVTVNIVGDAVDSVTVTAGGSGIMGVVTATVDAPDAGVTATVTPVYELNTLNAWSSKSTFGNGAATRTQGPGGLACEWLAHTDTNGIVAIGYEVCWYLNNYKNHLAPQSAPKTILFYGSTDNNPFEHSDGVVLTDTDKLLKSNSNWTLLDVQSHVAGRMRFSISNAVAYKHYLLAVTRTHMPHTGDYNTTSVRISDFRILEEVFEGVP